MSARTRVTGVRDTIRGRIEGRVAGITRTDELEGVAARISSLEVAVAENVALEAPLERIVADLERAVAGVVERSAGDGVGP